MFRIETAKLLRAADNANEALNGGDKRNNNNINNNNDNTGIGENENSNNNNDKLVDNNNNKSSNNLHGEQINVRYLDKNLNLVPRCTQTTINKKNLTTESKDTAEHIHEYIKKYNIKPCGVWSLFGKPYQGHGEPDLSLLIKAHELKNERRKKRRQNLKLKEDGDEFNKICGNHHDIHKIGSRSTNKNESKYNTWGGITNITNDSNKKLINIDKNIFQIIKTTNDELLDASNKHKFPYQYIINSEKRFARTKNNVPFGQLIENQIDESGRLYPVLQILKKVKIDEKDKFRFSNNKKKSVRKSIISNEYKNNNNHDIKPGNMMFTLFNKNCTGTFDDDYNNTTNTTISNTLLNVSGGGNNSSVRGSSRKSSTRYKNNNSAGGKHVKLSRQNERFSRTLTVYNPNDGNILDKYNNQKKRADKIFTIHGNEISMWRSKFNNIRDIAMNDIYKKLAIDKLNRIETYQTKNLMSNVAALVEHRQSQTRPKPISIWEEGKKLLQEMSNIGDFMPSNKRVSTRMSIKPRNSSFRRKTELEQCQIETKKEAIEFYHNLLIFVDMHFSRFNNIHKLDKYNLSDNVVDLICYCKNLLENGLPANRNIFFECLRCRGSGVIESIDQMEIFRFLRQYFNIKRDTVESFMCKMGWHIPNSKINALFKDSDINYKIK